MKKKIDPREAEGLWASVVDAFSNLEESIQRLIEAEAWIPLGYPTFAEAWDAKMKNVALANSVKPYVIYAMLAEGLAPDDIVRATGWSPDQVMQAVSDHGHGVPVEGATVVRAHLRQRPRPRGSIHVEFDHEDYVWIKSVAKEVGIDLQDEVRGVVISHFRSLVKERSA